MYEYQIRSGKYLIKFNFQAYWMPWTQGAKRFDRKLFWYWLEILNFSHDFVFKSDIFCSF